MKDLNVELSITLDPKDIEDCDGVIFPGGLPDVDPELYGEENQGSMNLDRTLDDEQMAMIDAAVKAKKPILAICRGMQLVNVYFGGTLIQDLENGTMHKYVPNENSCMIRSAFQELHSRSSTVIPESSILLIIRL
ncbi:MAG: gamma-glutamyl-gamma-aminobutyrate hydrolase family protein [Pilosibacter sp.]